MASICSDLEIMLKLRFRQKKSWLHYRIQMPALSTEISTKRWKAVKINEEYKKLWNKRFENINGKIQQSL